jgi:hypothetical protein
MVRLLDESQGSSPLQGHGSWLMCEVALNMNMSLLAQLFEYPNVIIRGPTKGELNVE